MKDELKKMKRALIIVDMIKGFADIGALADPYVHHVDDEVARLVEQFLKEGDDIIAFQDWHTLDSEELKRFPVHCIAGSKECELVDALQPFEKQMKLIKKNCTSGFLTEEYQTYLKENQHFLKEIVVVGWCTDICVKDFAIPQAKYFDEFNLPIPVIVPKNCVETYHQEAHFDGPHYRKDHKRNDMNAWAFRFMEQAGVQLVKKY